MDIIGHESGRSFSYSENCVPVYTQARAEEVCRSAVCGRKGKMSAGTRNSGEKNGQKKALLDDGMYFWRNCDIGGSIEYGGLEQYGFCGLVYCSCFSHMGQYLWPCYRTVFFFCGRMAVGGRRCTCGVGIAPWSSLGSHRHCDLRIWRNGTAAGKGSRKSSKEGKHHKISHFWVF